MNEMQEKVWQFHKKLNFTISYEPSLLPKDIFDFRLKALMDELEEYRKAHESGDLVKMADALGDALYMLLGDCVAHGIGIERVFNVIHTSNMTKEPNPNRVDGKAIKGKNYSPPNLDFILTEKHETW